MNCKICGQPVRSGNVFHPACWETVTARLASEICDDYCRYAREIADQDLLEQQCESCPVTRLRNLGRDEYESG